MCSTSSAPAAVARPTLKGPAPPVTPLTNSEGSTSAEVVKSAGSSGGTRPLSRDFTLPGLPRSVAQGVPRLSKEAAFLF